MGSNTNGIAKRPQTLDGEGVDPTDFNNLSAWARAHVNDLVFGALMRLNASYVGPQAAAKLSFAGIGSNGPLAPRVFAIGHSGAPRTRLGNLSYGSNAGPLFFYDGSSLPDGSTALVKSYYMQQDEISGAFAGGDAANPRLDAIYVRISEVDGPIASRNFEDAIGVKTTQAVVVDKRTQLEWTIVQGTAAAKPQVPAAPDATWACWGVYWIPKGWTAPLQGIMSHGSYAVYDYRIPCERYTRHVADVSRMYAASNAGTAHTNGYDGYASFSGTGPLAGVAASLPTYTGRLMGFGFTPLAADPGSVQRLWIATKIGAAVPSNPPFFASIYGGNVPGDPTIPAADVDNYSMRGGEWLNASGIVTTTSASGFALLPMWANGMGSTAEDGTELGGLGLSGGGEFSKIQGLWIPNATTDQIVACAFDVAG